MPVIPPFVRFGVFELDLGTGELTRDGRRLKLQEQPLRLLRLLLETPGQPVTRDKLKEALWPADTFVHFDHSLNAAVAKLRQALGDSAENPRFIETMARRGYRFIAPVAFVGNSSGDVPQVPGPNGLTAMYQVAENSPALETAVAPGIRTRAWVGLSGLLAVVMLTALALWLWNRRQPGETELRKLTDDTGLTMDPAVSADGNLLAYTSDRGSGGNLNIWIQQLGPGYSAVQVTHGNADAAEPTFSPDSGRVAFHSKTNPKGIYVVPVIGGGASRLTQSGRSPRFSPDGQWIAYWSDETDTGPLNGMEAGPIYFVSARGGEPRRIALDLPEGASPVWSPDSKYLLVYVARSKGYSLDEADWWMVSLDGKRSKRTGIFSALRRQGFSIGLARVPLLSQWNGNFITFAAGFGDAINIWRMPVSGDGDSRGPAERLTSGTTIETAPTVTATGELIFASLNRNTAVWSLPGNSDHAAFTGEIKRITDGPAELLPSISVDGKKLAFSAAHRQSAPSREAVAFSDQDAAELHARIKDLVTGEETAVSNSEPVQWHPQISRDGSTVAYTSGKPGQLYAASTNGGARRLVLGGPNYFTWDWSLDNKRLLFNTSDPWIHSIDTLSGSVKPFLSRPGYGMYQAKFSPDDHAVVAVGCHDDVRPEGECQLYIVPLERGAAVPFQRWTALDHPSRWDDKPRWSPSGNLLYFLSDRDGSFCLWAQRISGDRHLIGTPFAVYHLHKARRAVANLGTSLTEIGVARDKIVLGLQDLTGNIWSLRRR